MVKDIVNIAFADINEQADIERQFKIAQDFFNQFPDEVKLYRATQEDRDDYFSDNKFLKEYYDQHLQFIQSSFIKVNGKPNILMLASEKGFNVLGKGTSGKVKLAIDPHQNIYAIKISPKISTRRFSGGLQYNTFFKLAEAENRKSKDLRSAPDADLLTRVVDNKSKIYAVQYYLGETLSKKLRRNDLSFNQRMDLAIKIASKVHELHTGSLSQTGQCYAHCDLKPDNITIDEKGEVHLVDLGSAVAITDHAAYELKGTPLYFPINSDQLFESDSAKKAQEILDENGPVFCDLIALKRILFLSDTMTSENSECCSIFRKKDFDQMSLVLQARLSTDCVESSLREEAIDLVGALISESIQEIACVTYQAHRDSLVSEDSVEGLSSSDASILPWSRPTS